MRAPLSCHVLFVAAPSFLLAVLSRSSGYGVRALCVARMDRSRTDGIGILLAGRTVTYLYPSSLMNSSLL